MTSTYSKPVWRLLLRAVDDLPTTFTSTDMVEWFANNYEKIRDSTVRVHLRFASVNVKPDVGHPNWPGDARVLYKLDRTRYTRYTPEVHGVFENGQLVGSGDEEAHEEVVDDDAESRFALELHLEEFMEANWASIDFGAPLLIWRSEDGESGRQFDTDVGIIDFLCEDTTTKDLVVIELKRGKSSDTVLGQVLRYMGWVRKHLADGRGVRGVVVTHETDERIRYAVAEVPNVEAWTYGVSFSLNREAYK